MDADFRGVALAQTVPNARHLCPACSHTRKNKHDKCLSVTVDGSKYLYQCWHCGVSGAGSLTERRSFRTVPETRRPIVIPSPSEDEQEIAFAWLSQRGITRATALQAGVIGKKHFIEGEAQIGVGFPYSEGGHTYAIKWRSVSGKAFSQSGSANTLWLSDMVKKGDPLVITEGEVDCLSLWQVGVPAVSVPSGALNREPVSSVESNKTKYLAGNSLIEATNKVVIAVDADEPGNFLAEELARRIGRVKCWRAFWPDGCKDANDVLRRHGADVLRECIEKAQPWPVKGLYEAINFFDGVYELYEKGMPKGQSTGFKNVDELYTVVPGQVTIVTGSPGSGKSTFVDNILVRLAKESGWRIGLCSFENPPHVHAAKLVGIHCSAPFFQGPTPRMDSHQLGQSLEWIQDHFVFLHQADGSLSKIEDIVDLAKAAVLRYGIRGLVVDPYNFIDRGDSNETDWVSDALTKLKVLAMAHDLHIWFVAHPTKMRRKEDGTFPVPTGYDIAGCYSDDTEVLTKRGWRRHAELSMDDEVACFDPETETMIYSRPSRIIRKEYTGPVHHMSGYGYDLLVTPEHRMLVSPYWQEPKGTGKATGIGRPVRWPKGRWSFIEAKDLPKAQFSLPLAAPDLEPKVDVVSDNMARLAGWYASEGSKVSSGVSIAQAIGPRSRLIEDLLVSMNIPYTYSESEPGGKGGKKRIAQFYIGATLARSVVEWLHRECGIGSTNKKIPDDVMNGSSSVRRAFLEAYLLGDGSPRRDGWSATTTSSILRDQLQHLCLDLGISCSWHERRAIQSNHHTVWQLNVCRAGRNKTSLHVSRNMKMEQYNGVVWCLTVPTGAYFVRRNGKASACGNSAHFFNKADMGITIHRPEPTNNTTEFHTWKVRFSFTGKIGKTSLTYDVASGTYWEPYHGA